MLAYKEVGSTVEIIDPATISKEQARDAGVEGPKALKYKPAGSSKLPSTKRPRIPERNPTRVREQIEKDIARAVKKDPDGTRHATNYVGRWARRGYVIVATDGHRLLAAKGPADPDGKVENFSDKRDHGIVFGPEFGERLIEVATMADDRSHLVKMRICDGAVSLEAETAEYGEAVAILDPLNTVDAPDMVIGLNWKYLKPALGAWDLYFSFNNATEYVVLQPMQLGFEDDWYYVLMPMRA